MVTIKSCTTKDLFDLEEEREALYKSLLKNISIQNEKVSIKLGKSKFSITNGQLLLSLIFLPIQFLTDKKVLDKSDLFIPEEKSNPINLLTEYINNTLNNNPDMDRVIFQETLAYCLEVNAKYMYAINEVKGNTINMYEMFKLMETDKELYDIINFNIDESLQYHDMEESINQKFRRLIEKLSEGDNCYINLLRSVSPKQFQQVCVNIGLKPDLYGNIYPTPINTSFLRGLRNEKDYFINAMGARKALVTNAK